MKRCFLLLLFLVSLSLVSAFSINDFFPGITGNVVSNSNPVQSNRMIGNYSGFYKFPETFFDEAILPRSQVVKATDGQYLALVDMHNGLKPYDFCKIEYQQDVYGMTTPTGIKLGDAAKPSLNKNRYRWEVVAHEQGHNFFGGTSSFYWTIVGDSGPFIQESFAVLSAFYTHDYILRNRATLGISSLAIKDIRWDFANGRKYQKEKYDSYVAEGANFNMTDVKTSQALDYMMILYGERYGFENYQKFSRAFSDEIINKFDFHVDGVSEIERSTYVIATLSASFKRDFRQDFRNLNFPIDDRLYLKVYSVLSNEFYGSSDRLSVNESNEPKIISQQRQPIFTRIRNALRR